MIYGKAVGENRIIYRSIMLMRGATRLEAQTAAVMSEVIRHGRSFVFHFCSFKGLTEGGFGSGLGTMTVGEESNWDFSRIASSRPLRGMFLVIVCKLLFTLRSSPSQRHPSCWRTM